MFTLLALLIAQDYPNVAEIDFSKFPKLPEKRTGNTIRVSPRGESIAAAVEKANPGDTILLLEGKHALEDTVTIERPGIRLTSEGAVSVVPANPEVGYAFILTGDDLVLDGFTIEGFAAISIQFGRSDGSTQKNLVLANLTVKGGSDGIGSVYADPPAKKPQLSGLLLQNVRVEGCTLVGFCIGQGPVHDVRLENVTVAMGKGEEGNSGADAISAESGDNIFINRCTVTGATADGIDLKATRVCVYNTVVHDCSRNGVKFWFGGDLVNSLVYNTGADASVVFGATGTYRVLHTTVANHRGGYSMTVGYDEPEKRGRLILANSIFFKNSGSVWVSKSMELEIRHCLFHGSQSGYELAIGEDLYVESDADWKNVKGAVGNFPLSTVPNFTDDFRLLANSPGVDAGAPVDRMPPTDRTGKKRQQGKAPDLGPDEVK